LEVNQPVALSRPAVQQPKKGFSWVPVDGSRAQMAKNNAFVHLILEGRLYSLEADLLLDLIAGQRESLRIFRCEEHP
jgi:hypothetical protein